VFQRFSSMEPKIVGVKDCLHPLRYFNIDAGVIDEDSGIEEVRLPLNLAAPQTREQTVRLDQTNPRLRETNAITDPERKLATDKIWIVEDRVEPCGSVVSRITVSLRREKGAFEPQVIAIQR